MRRTPLALAIADSDNAEANPGHCRTASSPNNRNKLCTLSARGSSDNTRSGRSCRGYWRRTAQGHWRLHMEAVPPSPMRIPKRRARHRLARTSPRAALLAPRPYPSTRAGPGLGRPPTRHALGSSLHDPCGLVPLKRRLRSSARLSGRPPTARRAHGTSPLPLGCAPRPAPMLPSPDCPAQPRPPPDPQMPSSAAAASSKPRASRADGAPAARVATSAPCAARSPEACCGKLPRK